jgi:hypothetical protein
MKLGLCRHSQSLSHCVEAMRPAEFCEANMRFGGVAMCLFWLSYVVLVNVIHLSQYRSSLAKNFPEGRHSKNRLALTNQVS